MDGLHNQVFQPVSLTELFAAWKRLPGAVVYAGGTELLRGQGDYTVSLPRDTLYLSRIDELARVNRTERYLEVGAMVTLSDILDLGKIVPEVLRRALAGAANPQVRNLATIGGCLCRADRRLDAFAPLAVLDARLELRSADAARWISAARFAPDDGPPQKAEQELLTRIRIPLEDWDYAMHRRFGTPHRPSADSAVFSCIAHTQKGFLTDFRLAMAGRRLIRDREIDNLLIGRSLPLNRREAATLTERWREYLDSAAIPEGLFRSGFLNSVEQAVLGLAD
jgi:CO/xanthine dehydrogenase FAD-binding subunit